MKVLVVGAGGREQAIANCLRGSADVTLGSADDARTGAWDLVVIGPEQPLVAGLADELTCPVIGPSAAAAQLEGSKAFMKAIVSDAGVPTAAYAAFEDHEQAKAYVDEIGAPLVLKTDGLAAGKGVVICETLEQAHAELAEYFDGKFGDAGKRVVIEEFLTGPEISVFYLVRDGKAQLIGSAQDHKRLLDHDQGPNTGGMGTFAPSPLFTSDLAETLARDFIAPTLQTMAVQGCPFEGFLFAGLMLTPAGPKLLEYNVRMGDPETQSLLPLIDSDFLAALTHGAPVHLSDKHAVTVVIAAPGYPFAPEKGGVVCSAAHRDAVAAEHDAEIIMAGAKLVDDQWIASGGRVVNVTAVATTHNEARTRAYAAATAIGWTDGHYRTDIGASAQ